MKKLLAIVLTLSLVLGIGVSVYANETSEDTDETLVEKVFDKANRQGRGQRGGGDRAAKFDELLADYPDELAEIKAIHEAVEAGDMTKEEAQEAMTAYADILPEKPEYTEGEGKQKGNKGDKGAKLEELLADYPDELAEIQAIHAAVEAGDMTKEEAKEAMTVYADILPERTERADGEGREKGDKGAMLEELLADYPDELAEIQAIQAAVEAGDMTREEAHEAMAAYADILPERPEHVEGEGRQKGNKSFGNK